MKQILIAARVLIADPAHWIRHLNATDENGKVVESDSPYAVCWCGIGALLATADHCFHARAALDKVSPEKNFLKFNDNPTTTHAAVLALFDKAIASC